MNLGSTDPARTHLMAWTDPYKPPSLASVTSPNFAEPSSTPGNNLPDSLHKFRSSSHPVDARQIQCRGGATNYRTL